MEQELVSAGEAFAAATKAEAAARQALEQAQGDLVDCRRNTAVARAEFGRIAAEMKRNGLDYRAIAHLTGVTYGVARGSARDHGPAEVRVSPLLRTRDSLEAS